MSQKEQLNEMKKFMQIAEGKERPYVCHHNKKGKHECKADSSYGAAKKAADHWGLDSTAGVSATLADVKQSTQFVGEAEESKCPYCDDVPPLDGECFNCGLKDLDEDSAFDKHARTPTGPKARNTVINIAEKLYNYYKKEAKELDPNDPYEATSYQTTIEDSNYFLEIYRLMINKSSASPAVMRHATQQKIAAQMFDDMDSIVGETLVELFSNSQLRILDNFIRAHGGQGLDHFDDFDEGVNEVSGVKHDSYGATPVYEDDPDGMGYYDVTVETDNTDYPNELQTALPYDEALSYAEEYVKNNFAFRAERVEKWKRGNGVEWNGIDRNGDSFFIRVVPSDDADAEAWHGESVEEGFGHIPQGGGVDPHKFKYDVVLKSVGYGSDAAKNVSFAQALKAAEKQLQMFHDISIGGGGDEEDMHIEKTYYRPKIDGQTVELPEWMIKDKVTGEISYLIIQPTKQEIRVSPIAEENSELPPIHAIARDIVKNWKKVNFGAAPYLDAMQSLSTKHDDYGADSGSSILAYGLSNMSSYSGRSVHDPELAKKHRAQLKQHLKEGINLGAIVENVLQEYPGQPRDYDEGDYDPDEADQREMADDMDDDFEKDYINPEIEDEELGLRFD